MKKKYIKPEIDVHSGQQVPAFDAPTVNLDDYHRTGLSSSDALSDSASSLDGEPNVWEEA